MNYAVRNDGDITLTGSEYNAFQDAMERAKFLCSNAHAYLLEVDNTARDLYVYKQDESHAIGTGDVALLKKGHDLKLRLFGTLLRQRTEAFRPYLNLEKRKRW